MRFSHQYKYIFFANPKTGSSTVRQLLDPYSEIKSIPFHLRTPENPFHAHMRPVETKLEFDNKGWDFEEYYKFTMVRNPWARLVSLYEMIYSPSVRHKNRPLKAKIKQKFLYWTKPSFKNWLFTVKPNGMGAGTQRRKGEKWRIYGSYSAHEFISDEKGQILVDEVVKLEELSERLPAVWKKIGLPNWQDLEVPHKNKGRHKTYVPYYDDESQEYVYAKYRADIDAFNYSFGD